jgi:hypothetical protein
MSRQKKQKLERVEAKPNVVVYEEPAEEVTQEAPALVEECHCDTSTKANGFCPHGG